MMASLEILAIALLAMASRVAGFSNNGRGRAVEMRLCAAAMDRRSALPTMASSLASALLFYPTVAASSTNNKPRAPLDSLIPATQKLVSMERAVTVASKLMDASGESKDVYLQELRSIIAAPDEDKSFDNSMTIWTQRKLQKLESSSSPQGIQLSGTSVRAAFNIYTANLRFGEEYLVNDPDWKKSYIRANDGLPDVKQIITADLDLRDLYRNQAQLKIDDVQAELYSDRIDEEELVNLLKQALVASQQWFDMIDPLDIKDARNAAVSSS